ncbi:Prephenate dehydrogenase [Synechococcus sp. WH 8103]|jgi:arogenate dehydrogenase (NADP+)|uniref:Prephenate dehydrogenase n=2 Tax=Parasynechococcus TaxID=2881427 RepID=Q7U4K9_PARMW|nr:Prephenate dehydrogenase [Synechococcus sp. BOUM118]CAE08573.1 Prephenate dehydrogenase [Parasynechococcus marenigrum WH 8102]CRY93058.1 Prephenate dehydrogenase [Synechococcus sp. WH 8103]
MGVDSGCVGIVGLGLIGGSIGLDLRAQGIKVQGLVHRSSTAERAMERGLVSAVSTDPACLACCDLVILALPIPALLKPNAEFLEALPAEAVVTDVGSVKQPVLQEWKGRHPRFVASHPMAGTAQAGVEAGQRDLFQGRPWIATPDAETDSAALAVVEDLARRLGSRWFTAGAAQHDQAVALISHMPVLVSAALLRAAGDERDPEIRALAQALASSGFADTSRVGGGNPDLGVAMASSNREAVLKALAAYRWSLEQLEDAVIKTNWDQLHKELTRTQHLRPGFLDASAELNP